MINILYKWKLINQKKRALFECYQDLKYIEKFKGNLLNHDESKPRRRMAELKKIANPSEQEQSEMDVVLQVIADVKAVKLDYRKTKELIKDITDYISIL